MKKIIKIFLTVCILLTIANSYSQMRPIDIVLKSGERLSGTGKIKSKSLKFKPLGKRKSQFIELSKIKTAEIFFTSVGTKKYAFFTLTHLEEIIAVEELVIGKKASLYFTNSSSPLLIVSGGDFLSFRSDKTTYYAKMANDEKLTQLGDYIHSSQKLKIDIKIFFNDCKLLKEKIENKEFTTVNDMEKMFILFNKEC